MAKYYGTIGYAAEVEAESGVWINDIIERKYRVEILKHSLRYQSSGQVNDNVNISNRFSIVADSYAKENSHLMKYVEFMGTKWKISEITVEYPRLILTIGGVYNGQ